MSYPISSAENEFAISGDNQFDVKKFIYKIIGVLPWFIVSVVVCIIISRIYLRYTMPVNKISAYLLIKSQDEGGNSEYKTLKEMGLVTQNKDVENEMDIIRSFSLMRRVVDSLHLNVNIYKEGRVTASPTYGEKSPVYVKVIEENPEYKPGGFKLNMKADNFTISEGSKPQTINYGDTFETDFGKLVMIRNKRVRVDPDGFRVFFTSKEAETKKFKGSIDVRLTHDMGGIVEISMLDEVPERGVMIVNKLIEVYNNAGLDDKNVANIRTIRFLNERIDTVAEELNAVELNAQRFKTSNKINSISAEATSYLGQAIAVDNKKSDQEAQLKVLESLENYLVSGTGEEAIPSSLGISEPTLLSLINTHNTLLLEKQRMSISSTENDPTMARLTAQLKDIRDNLIRNIRVLKSGFNSNLNQVQSTYGNIESKIAGLPGKERQLLNITRQINLGKE